MRILEDDGVTPIIEIQNRLNWFGHVEKKNHIDSIIKKVVQIERTQIPRSKRPRKTIKKIYEINELDKYMILIEYYTAIYWKNTLLMLHLRKRNGVWLKLQDK